jgi:hypothetical protein
MTYRVNRREAAIAVASALWIGRGQAKASDALDRKNC